MKILPVLNLRRLPLMAAGQFLLMAALLFSSCKETGSQKETTITRKILGAETALFETGAFSTQLAHELKGTDTSMGHGRKQRLRTVPGGLRFVYQGNDYKPLWLEEKGVTETVAQLIAELDSLQWDGMNPAHYHINELKAGMRALQEGKAELKDAIAFDTLCTSAYLQAAHDLLLGVLIPGQADSLWYHSNDSSWNAPDELLKEQGRGGRYASLNGYRSQLPAYGLLRMEYRRYMALSADPELRTLKEAIYRAPVPDSLVKEVILKELPWLQGVPGDSLKTQSKLLRKFQAYYGIIPTGKTDSITLRYLARSPDSVLRILRVNLERLRWIPAQLEDQYVWVNIPLMELFFNKDGQDTFHMKVVVGNRSHQTPVLNAYMANVVLSPSWGVPPTILKQEVLPGINRRGDAYLASKGLHAYDNQGRPVSAANINSSNYKRFTFRQPPGARNALGEVKFNLPNKWDIYLHDTPNKSDFARRFRAKSHGCIRVEHPRELAAFLLNDLDKQPFDSVVIDSIIQTRQTQYEPLQKKIMVHILYLTALEDLANHRIRFVTDIYARDERLAAALDL